jgi:hypothetical protein
MAAFVDITGKKFGRLTVIKRSSNMGKRVMFACECECTPNQFFDVRTDHLQTGHTLSCGCLGLEKLDEGRLKHGAAGRYERHPLYSKWCGMIQRCYNKNSSRYEDYGGRGIKVCEEWHTYEPYRDYILTLPNCPKDIETQGVILHLTIDRIRNNEGYKPGNVQWATHKQQMNNTRRTYFIIINGEKMLLRRAVSLYAKAPYETVKWRLNQGWTKRSAFFTLPGQPRIQD